MPFFFGFAVPDKLEYMSQISKSIKNRNHKPVVNSLRKHRKARGLKQKEVACILGLKSGSTISRWENGLCLPNPKNMFKLGLVYRTMVDVLFIDLRRLLREEIAQAEQGILQSKAQNQDDR